MTARGWWGAALVGLGLLALSRRVVRYLHPVPGATVSSPFGPRVHPTTGDVTEHNGVDLAAPVGTPVLAPDSGTVAQVYQHPRGGLSLVLMLDDGNRAGFAHLHTVAVAPGDTVSRGEQVATVGASGVVTGPHLHFTLSREGRYFDPLPLIG